MQIAAGAAARPRRRLAMTVSRVIAAARGSRPAMRDFPARERDGLPGLPTVGGAYSCTASIAATVASDGVL